MNALVAIAWRELYLRRWILLLAVALGLVPMAMTFAALELARAEGVGSTTLAMILGVSALVIAGLSAGWSTMGVEASDGRLGFLYSRPVAWWAIWAGKLGAAVALSMTAGLLAILPSVVTDFGHWRAFLSPSITTFPLAGFVVEIVLLVAVANAASVVYRGQPPGERSTWPC